MKKYLGLIALTVLCLSVPGCKKPAPAQSAARKPTTDKPVVASEQSKAIAENMSNGVYTILVLQNGEDANGLHTAMQSLARDVDKCECIAAPADDASLKPLLKEMKYSPGDSPTTHAIAIAPNRVVTGVFKKAPTAEAFKEAILPEQPLAVRKALLNGKTVIVKMQSSETSGNEQTDKAIQEFLANSKSKAKTEVIAVDLERAENEPFLKQLKIDPAKEKQSVILAMAPPMKVLNKPFRGAAKKLDVAKAVDPSCKSCGPKG